MARHCIDFAGAGSASRPCGSRRLVCRGPSPRKLTDETPSLNWLRVSNWLASPITPAETASRLVSSSIVGAPCAASSSASITSTGAGASSREPLISEPVTMIVRSSAPASCAAAGAQASAQAAIAAADTALIARALFTTTPSFMSPR